MIRLRSVRFRLLAAVNAAIVGLLGTFLVVDYRQEIGRRVAEQRLTLEEESKTLLPGLLRIRSYGQGAVQRYIDDVCGRMQESSSPGHHIAVRFDDTVLQARAHDRASPEMLRAMQAAARSPRHQAVVDGEHLVVGTSRQGDTVVYVSTYLSRIHATARQQVLHRLLRIVLLLVVTAVVVNAVFLRMAVHPVHQLVRTVRRIGNGELDVRTGPFGAEEFDYLADAVNGMGASLAEAERRRRLEMDRARRIQEQLVPDTVQVAGLKFAHVYRPAEDVAGDYYDIISLSNSACLVCVADVARHGVAAALSAAMLKGYLQAASEHHSHPGQILRLLNHRVSLISPPDNLTTMCIVVVDADRKALRYASAGHEIALLLKASGKLLELPSTGVVLGVDKTSNWSTGSQQVAAGDRLLLLTDGVTEAMNPQGELFGRQRLAELFVACRDIGVDQTIQRMEQELRDHCAGECQDDDVTLVVMEIAGRNARSER